MWLVCTQVILEVLSYVGVIDFGFDPRGFEDIRISYPGQLEKLGRLHTPSADDDFPLGWNNMFFPTMYESHTLSNPLTLGLLEHDFLDGGFAE